MHKNRLQEYTQRSLIALPVYQTINEGFQHAPKFRSTVMVDGETYTSSNTFSHRKAAEQDVAKLALECISKKIKTEECPLIIEPQSSPTLKQHAVHLHSLELKVEINTRHEDSPRDKLLAPCLVVLHINPLMLKIDIFWDSYTAQTASPGSWHHFGCKIAHIGFEGFQITTFDYYYYYFVFD
ncbi:hypothetical protein JRO89_XS11G0018200 [Xanthoceras sorbifolium]|uniref:DRBM domain-containing protein n=1 Tax=Xanthoceras sorbifolium TaxID=99658 RepID=A0ABQ8HEA3_9ROSI|nr:hypothetical protein JRO89_XS11G0018200 [Xanthoceras sorbifolium]